MKVQGKGGKRPVRLYWMNRSEAEDDGINELLTIDFALLRERKILPVIIESGEGDLEEQLYLLMKRCAESKQIEPAKAS